MHPSSLLSYYPTYSILDEIVSYKNYKELTIFVDLKNVLQSTYMEHAIVNIVESTKKSRVVDTSIFSSLISFLSFHKIYGIKRGISTKFIIFFETGPSYYHKNISKTYKISRAIDDLYGLDKVDRDLFFSVLQSNFQLIERACNKIPNLSVIRLSNLEADFVPYYILTRKLVENNGDTGFVIYSNDHDMWQCLSENVFIYSKAGKNKKILKHGKVVNEFLKKESNIPDEYYSLVMSIIGDPGDDVVGVNGVGPKRFIDVFPDIVKIFGSMSEIYDKVEKGQDIFNIIPDCSSNKHLGNIVSSEVENKTISNNLKLVSFELISRFLENPKTTETLERRNEISRILSEEKKIASSEAMKKALEMNKVFIEEASIDFLYI